MKESYNPKLGFDIEPAEIDGFYSCTISAGWLLDDSLGISIGQADGHGPQRAFAMAIIKLGEDILRRYPRKL